MFFALSIMAIAFTFPIAAMVANSICNYFDACAERVKAGI